MSSASWGLWACLSKLEMISTNCCRVRAGDSQMFCACFGSEVSCYVFVSVRTQAENTRVTDSKVLYRLERWKQDPDLPTTTVFLRQADCLQRGIARRAYRIIGGSENGASALFPPLRSASSSLQPPAADVSESLLILMTSALVNTRETRTFQGTSVGEFRQHISTRCMLSWMG